MYSCIGLYTSHVQLAGVFPCLLLTVAKGLDPELLCTIISIAACTAIIYNYITLSSSDKTFRPSYTRQQAAIKKLPATCCLVAMLPQTSYKLFRIETLYLVARNFKGNLGYITRCALPGVVCRTTMSCKCCCKCF